MIAGRLVFERGLQGLPCLQADMNRDAYALHRKRRGARKVLRALKRQQRVERESSFVSGASFADWFRAAIFSDGTDRGIAKEARK